MIELDWFKINFSMAQYISTTRYHLHKIHTDFLKILSRDITDAEEVAFHVNIGSFMASWCLLWRAPVAYRPP